MQARQLYKVSAMYILLDALQVHTCMNSQSTDKQAKSEYAFVKVIVQAEVKRALGVRTRVYVY